MSSDKSEEMHTKRNNNSEEYGSRVAKNSDLREAVLGFLTRIGNMEEEIKILHEKTANNELEIERLKGSVADSNSENGVEISTRQELHNFINQLPEDKLEHAYELLLGKV